MNHWNQFPLFRLLIPFLTGIVVGIFFSFPQSILIALILVSFLILLFLHLKRYKYQNRWQFGIFTASFLFFFAIFLTNISSLSSEFQTNKEILSSEVTAKLKLIDQPVEKGNFVKVTAEFFEIKNKNNWKAASGLIQLYIKKEDSSLKLNYGDNILAKGDFKEVPKPANPGQFNYQKYLYNRHIFFQAFLQPQQWVNLSVNNGNFIKAFAFKLKAKLLNKLKEGIHTNDEYAVMSGLLIGDISEIDKDLVGAFSHTGVIHILSVSGMHVGIIYAGLLLIFRFFNRWRWSKILKVILLIGFLWFYALLTGLSPAVIRAAAMLSFMIIGDFLNKQTSIYNSIAASAFILLLYDPYFITQVGFQLSYLAVIGIVFLYKHIYLWYSPSSYIVDKLWSLIAVSLAAQLATVPLVLYYFHQFPNYFILANIAAIPISSAIIYGGLLMFFFSFWSVAFNFLALINSWLTLSLNTSIKWFNHLPCSVAEGLAPNLAECILLYLIIITITLFFLSKKRINLFAFGILFLVFLGVNIHKSYSSEIQRSFVVFSVNKSSVYNFIDGKSNLLIADSSCDEGKISFNCENYWDEQGLGKPEIHGLNESRILKNNDFFKRENFIQFLDKRISIVNKDFKPLERKEKMKLDYLIISGNPYYSLKEILKSFDAKKIIIDSSNPLYKTKKWLEEGKELSVKIYAVALEGAFEDGF